MSQNITLAKAVEMTSRYRRQRETILLPERRVQNILPVCETIDRSAVEGLFAQSGCVKLRVYFGMYEDLTVHTVLVGVDANDADLLPAETATDPSEDDGVIVNDGYRCPPICPPDSPLNR